MGTNFSFLGPEFELAYLEVYLCMCGGGFPIFGGYDYERFEVN